MDCNRSARIIALVAGAAGIIGILVAAPTDVRAERACSAQTFCGGWWQVCRRTLPPGGTIEECNRRRAACLSSRCFHFNSPRARCMNNAADMALTTACRR